MTEILGTLRQVYSNRVNKNDLYGTGSSKAVIAEGDHYVWSRAVTELDREDPEQLRILMMILCGTFFALRGQKEHSSGTNGSRRTSVAFLRYELLIVS